MSASRYDVIGAHRARFTLEFARLNTRHGFLDQAIASMIPSIKGGYISVADVAGALATSTAAVQAVVDATQ